MQDFDVSERADASIDAVEKALRCIRLAWARGELDVELIPGNYFGLYFLLSLRVTVHIVGTSRELHRLNGRVKRKFEMKSLHRRRY